MAMSSPSQTSTSMGLGYLLIPSSRARSPLSVRAAAPQPKWDLIDRSLHHVVRGISGDRTSLQALEVLLHRLPGPEEGRINAPDRMNWDSSLWASGPGVHGHHHHKVQQGVAVVVVLHQELRRCPSPALHQPHHCSDSTGMVVGACGQGEEEARPTPGRHRALEGAWPLQRWRHRGLSLEAGGAADGASASTVWDGSAAGGHGVCPWLALKFGDPAAHLGGAARAQHGLPGRGSPGDAA
jgi:hypothetical protein